MIPVHEAAESYEALIRGREVEQGRLVALWRAAWAWKRAYLASQHDAPSYAERRVQLVDAIDALGPPPELGS